MQIVEWLHCHRDQNLACCLTLLNERRKFCSISKQMLSPLLMFSFTDTRQMLNPVKMISLLVSQYNLCSTCAPHRFTQQVVSAEARNPRTSKEELLRKPEKRRLSHLTLGHLQPRAQAERSQKLWNAYFSNGVSLNLRTWARVWKQDLVVSLKAGLIWPLEGQIYCWFNSTGKRGFPPRHWIGLESS